MNSKASYFSVSLPLIKENMRRFWAIPVIAFLVYFLSGVFPVLMTYDKINNIASYIEMSLKNQQPFYMMAHLLVPVITAVVLYRYLQSVSSAAVMHSLPFTRAKLFNSNFISGLLMCTVPILINGIILLLICKPTYQVWNYDTDITTGMIDVFTRMDVLNWIGVSLLIVVVLFSIAVFAGIVTGNMFIHLMASFFFIFVVSALYGVFYLYFDLYLYGFNPSGQWEEICLGISPYTQVLSKEGHFTLIPVLYYAFTFVLMYVLSTVLYAKRKLERASDSLVFDFMKPIICYIIAFLGMTMLEVYFYYLGDESKAYLYAGFASGAVIFFIIGQMIILKTPRVFTLSAAKSFVIFVLISAVFVVSLNYDITGYEKRTPNPTSIKSATISESFESVLRNNQTSERELQDPENLAALAAFHRSIVENRTRFEEESNNLYYSRTLSFEYDQSTPIDMSRTYTVDYDFFSQSQEMKKIFESLEYKSAISLYGIGAESIDEIYLYPVQSKDDLPIINNAVAIKELISVMEKDLRAMTFEEALSLKRYYGSAEINYTYRDPEGKKQDGYINISIPFSFENTIDWLTSHGYDMAFKTEQILYIDIYDLSKKNSDQTEMYTDSGEKENVPALMRITDKEKIEEVLANSDRERLTENKSYQVEISYLPDYTDPNMNGKEFMYYYLNDGLEFLN